ncbi:hypothetical protein POTOM_055434 [Populus tomentosa]|uniref:Uncharacterized protein n=1 Tax=Populus tomentosa TaxID=118781 RepID=A0A8X8BZ58_POPTO|nr:hypothetical protein POTOM_055434 [Populus tomentosa]
MLPNMEVLLNAKAASSIPEYDDSNYNRVKEFKAFEETKAGVKGLVDSGVTRIPGFFVYAPENVEKSTAKAKTNSLLSITNDKFGSVEHRVLVGDVRSRTSVACFFHPSAANQFKPYGVMKELLSDGSLKYRGTHIAEFMACVSPCPRSPAIVVNIEVSDNAEKSINEDEESNYDRGKEVKAFEETKACVKGLVDSGASNIPRILSTHQRKCDSRLQMLVISAFRSQK